MSIRLFTLSVALCLASACGAGSLGGPASASPGGDESPDAVVLRASGPSGGPYYLDVDRVTLANPEAVDTEYELSATADWLEWDVPDQGMLKAGSELAVRISLARSGAPQDEGEYSAELRLRHAGTGRALRTVRVDLLVGPATSGWTDVVLSPDSREVFVSSSLGNDSNSGLTEESPKRTFAAAVELLRDGYPDVLRLLRGDSWDFTDEYFVWLRSGRSKTEPMVITYYGSSCLRPRLTNVAILTRGPANVSNLSVIGIHFERTTDVGAKAAGFQYLGAGENVLIEDCFVRHGLANLVIQGEGEGLRGFALRRSVVVDACCNIGTHAQGMYMDNTHAALIEQNVFDHNGWSESVAGADATVFNHNIYIQKNCTDVVVVGNVSARAASHGLQLRPGGVCDENLMVSNAIAILFGQSQLDFATQQARGSIKGNVVVDGRDITPSLPRGMGISLENAQDVTVAYNLVCHQKSGSQAFALTTGYTFENLTLRDNIVYDWGDESGNGSGLYLNGTALGTNRVERNHVQQPTRGWAMRNMAFADPARWAFAENHYFCVRGAYWMVVGAAAETVQTWISMAAEQGATVTAMEYPDASRDLASYWTALGESGGGEGLLQAMREQSRATWRADLTAGAVASYVRDGFGLQLGE